MAKTGLPILRQALPVLGVEQEKRLVAQLPQTREILVRHNLALVTRIATKHAMYAGRAGDLDLMSDLIQEGVEGFLYALEKFEAEREHKLSTYAIWWIEQRIRRYLDGHLRVVRLPTHLNEKMRRIHQGKSTIEQETKNSRMRRVMEQLTSQRGTIELSLDSLLRGGDEEGRQLTGYDAITSYDTMLGAAPGAHVEVDERLQQEQQLATLRDGLPAREFEVLWRRARDETLAQIGDSLGVTRERVRQIEVSATRKAKRLLQRLEAMPVL